MSPLTTWVDLGIHYLTGPTLAYVLCMTATHLELCPYFSNGQRSTNEEALLIPVGNLGDDTTCPAVHIPTHFPMMLSPPLSSRGASTRAETDESEAF